MLILSKSEMQRADFFTKNTLGVCEEILMENAGLAMANLVKNFVSKFDEIVVLCGPGNNGGDGIVLARRLKQLNFNVHLIFVDGVVKFSKAAAYHFKIYCNCGFDYNDLDLENDFVFSNTKLIVDAVFGIGFHGVVDAKKVALFEKVNASSAKVMSVDIPSGISADCGSFESAVCADFTAVVSYLKRSAFLFPAKFNYGKIILVDADIVVDEVDLHEIYSTWGFDDFNRNFQIMTKKPCDSKWTCGSAMLVAGSKNMVGAAILSAKACLKSGIGLLKLACPDAVKIGFLNNSVLEATYADVVEQKGVLSDVEIKNKFDVVACGPGISRSDCAWVVVKKVLLSSSSVVLDADALYFLNDELLELIKNRNNFTILTPHVREMAKMCKCDVDYVEKNKFELAKEKSKEWNVFLILKGPHTLIVSPNGEQFVNLSGNDSLAKGGSGDVLTGIVTAFVARCIALNGKVKMIEALCNAVFIHGYAADILNNFKNKARQSDRKSVV